MLGKVTEAIGPLSESKGTMCGDAQTLKVCRFSFFDKINHTVPSGVFIMYVKEYYQ